ncbi:MAG: 23S rRNA (adenine(2503)-C(2))-methyltransferase RlmN [Longimicrobiales bacterium]
MQEPKNLLGLGPSVLEAEVSAHFERRSQPSYRAGQVAAWVFGKGARSVSEMTNLPASERLALAEAFEVREPEEDTVSVSKDGTAKHLWRLADGEVVESVLIPAGSRLTLCISSQAGCAQGCKFCATGWSGFARQLDTAEIVGQYRASARWAANNGLGRVSNVVFMGMGEPLTNRKAVFPALGILNGGYGIGARRITVSTVGVIPGILALAKRPEQVRLALSLHAPISSLRRELIPLEERYPLPDLMDALEEFNKRGGRQITFEYTMIRGLNDSLGLIAPLAELAKRVHAFVNLIPFNPIPFVDYKPSSPPRVRDFQVGLNEAGVEAHIREPRGRDIDAACGQLKASRQPELVALGLSLGKKRLGGDSTEEHGASSEHEEQVSPATGSAAQSGPGELP